MAKKYQPTGYQIIDLGQIADGDDLVGATGGNVKDKELLCELLFDALENPTFLNAILKKPIYLTFIQDDNETLSGVATFHNYGDGTGELVMYDRAFNIYLEIATSPTKTVTIHCETRE